MGFGLPRQIKTAACHPSTHEDGDTRNVIEKIGATLTCLNMPVMYVSPESCGCSMEGQDVWMALWLNLSLHVGVGVFTWKHHECLQTDINKCHNVVQPGPHSFHKFQS